MSRFYCMEITVSITDKSKQDAIIDTIRDEWGIEYSHHDEATREFFASNDNYLGGGESEEEFVDRISKAIWQANGSFCAIEVTAIYLEDAPYEAHSRDADDYERLINKNETNDEVILNAIGELYNDFSKVIRKDGSLHE